jgi:predicted dehydrogenase
METDDVAVVVFEAENGCYGEVLVGYSLPPQFTEWRIAGENGLLTLDSYMTGPVRFWSRETDEWTEYEADNSKTRFQRQFAHFVECINEGKQPRSNIETALHTQRAIGAAYQAARGKGLPVQQRKTT